MKSSYYKASHRNAYRRPAELTQKSGIERVVHVRKRQPEGVFQMRSVEVLRWKVVRWLQRQPTHYSFMALIYWTDRDTENTNKHTKTQDQTFTLTEWELWSSRHKEGRCTCSTITMGTSSVQVFTKFITMWIPVGALSHFLVLKMSSRRSSFKRVTC